MLNRQSKKTRRFFRRPSGRTIFILIVILFPLAIIASYIDFPASIAFVRHYFTPPNHFTYHGHTAYVSGIAWSPDGKRLASASGDGTVQVWDAFSGGHTYTYRGHVDYYPGHYTSGAAVNSLAWSPDGKHIASASSDSTVQVWQPM